MTSCCPSVRSLRVPEDPLRTTFLYGEISDRKQHIVEGQSSRTMLRLRWKPEGYRLAVLFTYSSMNDCFSIRWKVETFQNNSWHWPRKLCFQWMTIRNQRKTKQYLHLPCVETFGQRSPYWKEKETNITLFCKCCAKMLDYKDTLLQFTFS